MFGDGGVQRRFCRRWVASPGNAPGRSLDDGGPANNSLKAPGRSTYDTATANTAQKAPGRSTGRASLRSSSLRSCGPYFVGAGSSGRPLSFPPLSAVQDSAPLPAGRAGDFRRLTVFSVANGQRLAIPCGWTGRGPAAPVSHTLPSRLRCSSQAPALLIPRTRGSRALRTARKGGSMDAVIPTVPGGPGTSFPAGAPN